ncbi:MAG: hypothetical protein CL933_01725 [Deltaproteobacteria bacterium]|nr:hypothetical protein [Deltaproteobacteria bacterium]
MRISRVGWLRVYQQAPLRMRLPARKAHPSRPCAGRGHAIVRDGDEDGASARVTADAPTEFAMSTAEAMLAAL